MDLVAIAVGPQEGLIVIVVLLLLFGAKRLPEIGKGLGKGIKEFRGAAKGLHEDDQAEDQPAPKASEKPADE